MMNTTIAFVYDVVLEDGTTDVESALRLIVDVLRVARDTQSLTGLAA